MDLDAMATYSCVVEGYTIEDDNDLTCVSLNDTAQWYPAEAPVCVEGKFDSHSRSRLRASRGVFQRLAGQGTHGSTWSIQAALGRS